MLTRSDIRRRLLPILLILLIAFALRTYQLMEIPPGLTHDEANHGREALGILDGIFLFFFPLNYGSEPLYSYTVAGSMFLLGENLLALRLVNVVFSLAAISITYLWACCAFDRKTALLGAALLAISFWPLASSREALRAGMLPFFMTGAVWFFWQLVTKKESVPATHSAWLIAGFAGCVAATLHIYLAARVAWLVFPLFLLYLAGFSRPIFQRSWLPTLIGLATAGLITTPMFVYVRNYPHVLTRLDMLDRPLQQLRSGDFTPLLHNSAEALLAFIWPGYGDHFLAYNIPGRPTLDAVTAVFFVLGILVCLWHWRRPEYVFMLFWLGVGILPSLITGSTANTTRNLAALPAVYLLPAIGFVACLNWLTRWPGRDAGRILPIIACGWLLLVGWMSARDYFIRWGPSPEVRGAYQHTLVEIMAYLKTDNDNSPVVISTVYPGPAHDPSIGLVLSPQSQRDVRWVDARYGLLWPHGEATRIFIPASTPPHPAFADLLHPVETISLRADDLDPSFTVYELTAIPTTWLSEDEVDEVNFDGAVRLIQSRWLHPSVSAGETAELLTIWKVIDPERVGPLVPPLYTTDVVLFTQVLDNAGSILAQRDSLDAPAWDWQVGDIIVQLHHLSIPAETVPGSYQTIVGLYDRQSEERRTVVNNNGEPIDTYASVAPLEVKVP